MLIDFEKMPTYARVWVYQANQTLTDNQVAVIENYLKPAVEKWASHGSALLAATQVLHHRFVVIALDESKYPASGCSIDASTRWFKDLGQELGIDFFDRSLAYLDGNEIKSISPFQVKASVLNGTITTETLIFNNQVNTFLDLSQAWQSKAIDTYLKKYFAEQTV